MPADNRVTLQINLAPSDAAHAEYTIPHKLRLWTGQVDEVLLVVDLHRSSGRYADKWLERLPRLRKFLAEVCASDLRVRVVETDYSRATASALAQTYFGGRPLPAKDWMGAPIYAYIYGLHAATTRYVLHTDSDMLFGGGSQTWITEAIQVLQSHPEVIACNPLPGPPTADGSLRSQSLERDPSAPFTYRSGRVSTRLFLLDRDRLHERIPVIPLVQPSRMRRAQAWVEGNPPYVPLEDMLSRGMEESGSVRVDFLGAAPGMWSLHPAWRSAHFYESLPALIHQIEEGDIPEGQRGHHDLNSAMMDWTGAAPSRWRRYQAHARTILQRFQPA